VLILQSFFKSKLLDAFDQETADFSSVLKYSGNETLLYLWKGKKGNFIGFFFKKDFRIKEPKHTKEYIYLTQDGIAIQKRSGISEKESWLSEERRIR
jgi:hypothetical protein